MKENTNIFEIVCEVLEQHEDSNLKSETAKKTIANEIRNKIYDEYYEGYLYEELVDAYHDKEMNAHKIKIGKSHE